MASIAGIGASFAAGMTLVALTLSFFNSARMRSMAFKVAGVHATNCVFYLGLLGGLDERFRFISYGICTPFLLWTIYDVETNRNPSSDSVNTYARNAMISISFSVVLGTVIYFLPATLFGWVYALSSIFFIGAVVLLTMAVNADGYSMGPLSWVFLLDWLVYPIVYLLGLSLADAAFWYTINDLISKVLFDLVYIGMLWSKMEYRDPDSRRPLVIQSESKK